MLTRLQYGGAHEHKGPADFADKGGGGRDEEDEEGGEEGGEQRGTPQPEHPMMAMQNHPGFQHVRHGTPGPPGQSPPMHNGQMPQFQRGPSPMPPGMSRPSSRADQHPGHMRRTSSNLAPQHVQGQVPQPNYAYTPNPPFYNPQAAGQNRQGPYPAQAQPPPGQATYPPPNLPPQGPPQHPHVQQMIVQDNRRSSMPSTYPPQQPVPGPAPQANMSRNPSESHLQPPPQHPQRMGSPQPPPQRATPSPQPPQQPFQSPPMPQPKPLPAQAKHSIFTPIDDSRSMLAANWGQPSHAEPVRSEPAIKTEGGPRSASIDVAAMQREKAAPRSNGPSPRPPPSRTFHSKSPQPPRPDGRSSVPNVSPPPNRQSTNQSDAKRPKLNLQIPAEHSGDEGTASALDGTNTSQPGTAGGQHQGPPHGVVLPPPSPSAGALLSAGAQGPPNPFARPAPPMSTNPHAMNRDANHIETPISALPSRFMSDNLLPSPSTFYPEWGFGRSNDSNMLPSPLNFQTPVVGNGQGWRDEERKRPTEDDGGGGDPKRTKT